MEDLKQLLIDRLKFQGNEVAIDYHFLQIAIACL